MGGACESLRLSPCVLVQPDGWARGEREGYGGPRDVTSLSLSTPPHQRVLPELSRTRPLHHDADEEHESGAETLCELIMRWSCAQYCYGARTSGRGASRASVFTAASRAHPSIRKATRPHSGQTAAQVTD